MIQGTSSGAGKTIIVAALCRILSDMGYAVAPFKSQNMSSQSYATRGLQVAAAQALQAAAARCDVTVQMNPVLLKPRGDHRTSDVYVNGRFHKTMDAAEYYDTFALSVGLDAAAGALESLADEFDVVVIEGAGSPAEINLARYDIANMRIAHMAGGAPVVLVSDIDRGGAFASLAGTMRLLPERDAGLVRGFVLNKFRGDPSMLEPGYGMIRDVTGVPVVGTIPMLDLSGLPDEDTLDARAGAPRWDSGDVPPQVEAGIGRLARDVGDSLDVGAVLDMVRSGGGRV